KVRSIDTPQATASALAQLIHDALGAIDVAVWLRTPDSQVVRLAAARGTASAALSGDTLQLADIPRDLTEPLAVNEMDPGFLKKWPRGLFERAKASLVVPMISSGRFVGLLTVGADRSGKAFDLEAREFLRVLTVHA